MHPGQPACSPGDGLMLSWNDNNTGTAATTGAFYDHVVILNTTTGQTLTTADVLYDPTAAGNGAIAAGDFRPQQFAFTLPQGVAGAGQLQFTVTTNYYNQVFECNTVGPGGTSTAESNNYGPPCTQTAALAPYADLATTNVTAPALTVGDPAQVTVGWTVTNQGTGPGTVATWVDSIIVSPDNDPTHGTVIEQFTHQGLLAVNGTYYAAARRSSCRRAIRRTPTCSSRPTAPTSSSRTAARPTITARPRTSST